MQSDLKPCPFCGWSVGLSVFGNSDHSYWVECPDCCAQGAPEETKGEAIVAWNTRAMTDAAKIARGLTKAQREAMLASHWSARQGVDLQMLGLTYWGNGPHGKPMIKFRQIGLAVRAELERNSYE